jgi:pyruvate dehydrogenase complex dehydrogenase (E1) component
MLQKVFHVEGSMPEIVIYDNNCQLYQYLENNEILLYKTVGFPVDVFHWECKHAKSGIACSYHCNPMQFPELTGEDGKAWFFNSSVAEQTNVWLGGYHSILREMGADKYDFFLDEMIMRKNRLTKAKLEAAGVLPDYIPNLTV